MKFFLARPEVQFSVFHILQTVMISLSQLPLIAFSKYRLYCQVSQGRYCRAIYTIYHICITTNLVLIRVVQCEGSAVFPVKL